MDDYLIGKNSSLQNTIFYKHTSFIFINTNKTIIENVIVKINKTYTLFLKLFYKYAMFEL